MPPTKRIAAKVALEIDVADDGNWVTMGGVQTIIDASRSNDEVDMTDMDDTIDQMYPAPITSQGDFSLTLFWDEVDTDQASLYTLVDSKAIVPMRIVFNSFSPVKTKTFQGWVKEVGETDYTVKQEVVKTCLLHSMEVPTDGTIP